MVEFTLVNGLVGGLVATIVMTAFMMALGDDSPPPTAQLWAKYVGDGEPEEYMMQGMVLHLLYGTVAGGVFALIMLATALAASTLVWAVIYGLVWGLVLFVIAAVLWMRLVLGVEPEMQMAAMFLLFHLVYGAVLGAWTGLELI